MSNTLIFLFTDVEGSTPLWEAQAADGGPASAR